MSCICGAGNAGQVHTCASIPPGEEGKGGVSAGRGGGGNKTADLEDVLFASKGSVIEVLCIYRVWGIDPPFLPGDIVNSAGVPTFFPEYLILVRIWRENTGISSGAISETLNICRCPGRRSVSREMWLKMPQEYRVVLYFCGVELMHFL